VVHTMRFKAISEVVDAFRPVESVEPFERSSFEGFIDACRSILPKYAVNLANLISDTSPKGLWHPNGFIVFKLVPLTNVGLLRLHIWPAATRVDRPWGPRLHKHGWHLASLVLAGTYTDIIFSDSFSQHAIAHSRRMATYDVLLRPNSPDLIRARGEVRYVGEAMRRNIKQGSFNFIPAHVLHDTVIPAGKYVATLAIQSTVIHFESFVAEEDDIDEERSYSRVVLPQDSQDRILADLLRRVR
jgi:hypothetical protein